MSSPRAVLLSDLHLGSCYLHAAALQTMLDRLPPGADLVLNGDVLDRRHGALPPVHAGLLQRLHEEADRRRVVWVRGNHDAELQLDAHAAIECVADLSYGRDLYIAHGHDFDNVMPKNRVFVRWFRRLHHLRVFLGAEAVHVARYAKKFPFFYRVLIDHVAQNAMEYARENGYRAVACGHTHWVEMRERTGIRYVNTGSWTEPPHSYALFAGGTITLETQSETCI